MQEMQRIAPFIDKLVVWVGGEVGGGVGIAGGSLGICSAQRCCKALWDN